jgi:hypothetical protein
VVRRLPSSHAGRTGGLLIAELVDNRCRCKPLQTPEGGQLSLAVILCRNLVQRGLRLSVGAQAISSAARSPTLIGAAYVIVTNSSPPRHLKATTRTPNRANALRGPIRG